MTLQKMIVEKLNLDDSLLKSVKMDAMTWKAKRPLDSSLNISKAYSTLTKKPFSIKQSLHDYIPQLKDSLSL